MVTESELAAAGADVYGMKSVDLVGYPLDPIAMAKIPLSLVVRHRVLGLAGIHAPGDGPDEVAIAAQAFANGLGLANGDLRLSSTSSYRKAGLDGNDVGCDIAALGAATAGVRQQ